MLPAREGAQPRAPWETPTCCFMVFVSQSSSLPGTWLVPLPPMSGANTSTWAVRLEAAAEQTKDAPLGLHARDRILQHIEGVSSGGSPALCPPAKEGGAGLGGSAKAKAGPPGTVTGGVASGSPGHIIIDVDFTEVLLGFRVVEAHGPHTAAQQQLEGEGQLRVRPAQRGSQEGKAHPCEGERRLWGDPPPLPQVGQGKPDKTDLF